MKKYLYYNRRLNRIRFVLYINSIGIDIFLLYKVKYIGSSSLFIYFFRNVVYFIK